MRHNGAMRPGRFRRGASLGEAARPFSSANARGRSGAMDLWEDWRRASPFTAGEEFFNLGLGHDVAFAADRFGGIRRVPGDFDGYEALARRVEHNYVRGWVAKDGSRMFIWDDLGLVVASTSAFEHLRHGLTKLRRKCYAAPGTELWDRGGERYMGTLGELKLLVERAV